MPSRKFLSFATQILRGLEAAHRRGLAHLDLKPENVFVTTQGAIKILDFGIARWIRPAVGPTEDVVETITAASPVVAGTLGYMAPEQVSGEPVDQRADLFAFGVLCYEMLTGRAVFARKTASETVRAILTEDPPDPLAATVPAAAIARVAPMPREEPGRTVSIRRVDVRMALEAVWGADVTRRRIDGAGRRIARGTGGRIAAGDDRRRDRCPRLPRGAQLSDRRAGAAAVGGRSGRHDSGPRRGDFKRRQPAGDGGHRSEQARHGCGSARSPTGAAAGFPAPKARFYPFWSPDDAGDRLLCRWQVENRACRWRLAARPVRRAAGTRRHVGRGHHSVRGGTETGLSQVRVSGGPVVQTTTLDASRSETSHRFPSFTPDGRHFTYLAMVKSTGTEGSVMFASIDGPISHGACMDSNAAAAWAPR